MSLILSKDILKTNECIRPLEFLRSAGDCYYTILQSDGDFVLYRRTGSTAFWSSRTKGHCANKACMQNDGNFVLTDCKNNPIWASNTGSGGNASAYLKVQDDGNLVVYRKDGFPIWASRTRGSCSPNGNPFV